MDIKCAYRRLRYSSMASQRSHDPVRQLKDQRESEQHAALGRIGRNSRCRSSRGSIAGEQLGLQQAIEHHRNGDNKTCNRAGNADIKEVSAVLDRRLDADKSAKRSNQSGSGNKKWQRSKNSSFDAINVMSQLVRGEDSHQRKREGKSHYQPMPVLQSPLPRPVVEIIGKQAQVAVEGVLHVGADAQRGKDRGQEQQRMQPVPPFRPMNHYDG